MSRSLEDILAALKSDVAAKARAPASGPSAYAQAHVEYVSYAYVYLENDDRCQCGHHWLTPQGVFVAKRGRNGSRILQAYIPTDADLKLPRERETQPGREHSVCPECAYEKQYFFTPEGAVDGTPEES